MARSVRLPPGATLIAGCSTSQGDGAIHWPGSFPPQQPNGNSTSWELLKSDLLRVEGGRGTKTHHHALCAFRWQRCQGKKPLEDMNKAIRVQPRAATRICFPLIWWKIAEQHEKSCGWVKRSFLQDSYSSSQGKLKHIWNNHLVVHKALWLGMQNWTNPRLAQTSWDKTAQYSWALHHNSEDVLTPFWRNPSNQNLPYRRNSHLPVWKFNTCKPN